MVGFHGRQGELAYSEQVYEINNEGLERKKTSLVILVSMSWAIREDDISTILPEAVTNGCESDVERKNLIIDEYLDFLEVEISEERVADCDRLLYFGSVQSFHDWGSTTWSTKIEFVGDVGANLANPQTSIRRESSVAVGNARVSASIVFFVAKRKRTHWEDLADSAVFHLSMVVIRRTAKIEKSNLGKLRLVFNTENGGLPLSGDLEDWLGFRVRNRAAREVLFARGLTYLRNSYRQDLDTWLPMHLRFLPR